MANAPAVSSIAVATSIPPRLARHDEGRAVDESYQRLCLRSFADCGFRILSVNHPDEIKLLASRHPEIEFVPTERTASAGAGRHNPYIADLLASLRRVPETTVGIVNADVLFEPSDAWRSEIPRLVQSGCVVTGQRYEAISLFRGLLRRYEAGLDYFFFPSALARELGAVTMPFAMGLPWWDYWFPAAAAFSGREIVAFDRPGIVHLFHNISPSPQADRGWYEYGILFAKYIAQQAAARPDGIPNFVATLVPICNEIAAMRADMDNPDHKRLIESLVFAFGSKLRERAKTFESAPRARGPAPVSLDEDDALNAVFQDFDARFAADEALQRAMAFKRNAKHAEAEKEFAVALHHAPEDLEILVEAGEFFFQRRELDRSLDLLERAMRLSPDSPRVLNSLGVCLGSLGRRDEAIEAFRRVIERDAAYPNAYSNLAVLLAQSNRATEALPVLDRALEKWPDFTRALELRARLAGARKPG